ncbi:MAG: GTA-gp10 family protein, partial [Henriciella sp.]
CVMCLTLGGLAEMEAMFGCTTLPDLTRRLAAVSAVETIDLVTILIRGGGSDPDDFDLANLSAGEASRAIAEVFRAALG